MSESRTSGEDSAALPEVLTRFADAMFCDDIRREETGKFFLVGLYDGVLQVAQAPVFLPGLAIFIRAKTPNDQPFEKFVVRIFLDDELLQEFSLGEENRHALRSVEPGTGEARPDLVHQIVAGTKIVPFPVAKAGTVRVRIDTGREILRAGALQIVVADPPSEDDGREAGPA